MIIFACDPGPVKSSYCRYDTVAKKPVSTFNTIDNKDFRLAEGLSLLGDRMVIEMVACYGMPVGEEIFETCVWIGQLKERAEVSGLFVDRMTRKEVKLHLCGSSRAKDGNVIQVMRDRFGDGSKSGKGTKKCPSLLYGIKDDEWQALALAVAYAETRI